MSETKFTRATLRIKGRIAEVEGISVYVAEICEDESDGYRGPVCHIQSADHLGTDAICREEAEANAHLIAAAPDLYAESAFLLERLAEWENEHLTDEAANDWAGHVCPSIERLRMHLARARGASQ